MLVMNTNKASDNWQRARRCNELAQQEHDPDLRAQFSSLAAQWVELAIKRESRAKNNLSHPAQTLIDSGQ
jgi:hypothetical protein